MKKAILVTVFLLTLSLVNIGCGVPKSDYENLQKELASTQKELDTNTALVSLTQNQLKDAQDEIRKLQGGLAAQTEALAQATSSNDVLQKQISDTQIKLYYRFAYQSWVDYDWPLSIPLKTLLFYKEEPRPVLPQYTSTIIDSRADNVMNILTNYIKDAVGQNNLKRNDVANLIAKFTGTLSITDRDVITPYDNYIQYPIETLFNQGGDSEDSSLLAAALLTRQGFDVVLFSFETQKHMAVGVYLPGLIGDGWDYQQKRYLYLETVAGGGALGICPVLYQGVRPTIIPVGQ